MINLWTWIFDMTDEEKIQAIRSFLRDHADDPISLDPTQNYYDIMKSAINDLYATISPSLTETRDASGDAVLPDIENEKFELFRVGELSRAGRIYSLAIAESIIYDINHKQIPVTLDDASDYFSKSSTIPLERVVGYLKYADDAFQDNCVMASIKLVETPFAAIFKELYRANIAFDLAISGTGMVGLKNNIKDFSLRGAYLIPQIRVASGN
jgi:hypothetical protein